MLPGKVGGAAQRAERGSAGWVQSVWHGLGALWSRAVLAGSLQVWVSVRVSVSVRADTLEWQERCGELAGGAGLLEPRLSHC